LFLPELVDGQMAIPSHGTRVDRERLIALSRLTVPLVDSPLHEGDVTDETLLH
jgi:hypothetical protein